MNIGDCVCSNVSPTMIGQITHLLNDNKAIVEVNDVIDKRIILVDLNYWHKVNT